MKQFQDLADLHSTNFNTQNSNVASFTPIQGQIQK